MHLKGYCVDHRLLRTGSANFSRSGETRQDNDLVALRGSSVCAGFDAKFDSSTGLGATAEEMQMTGLTGRRLDSLIRAAALTISRHQKPRRSQRWGFCLVDTGATQASQGHDGTMASLPTWLMSPTRGNGH
jgi:phosphatidylserine/phosphatidylglycerophosphate/cardiolipin synthase-like enzyme